MRILSIESSALVASVAVVDDNELLGQFTTNHKKTHSQSLMPMLDELVKQLELDLKTIDAIAIAGGPGSYTGLRIGSATVKGLGLALKKPIINVPTLEAMANNFAFLENILICPIVDARRNQVYSGIYENQEVNTIAIREDRLLVIDQLLLELKQFDKKCVFLGDGVMIHSELIRETFGEKALFAPVNMNRQNAASVAKVAEKYYALGKIESPEEHGPVYLRLAQAERELKEKTDATN